MTTVHAAGSLRAAFTALGGHFEQLHRQPLSLCFGAAGLLKERIATGEPCSLFASANLAHPQALVAAGRSRAVLAFARNRLCLLATPGFAAAWQAGPAEQARSLLDPLLRIGTSTPGADPSGDYAWQLFEQIEARGDGPAGCAAVLKAKALQLTGRGQKPPQPAQPAGRSLYGSLLAQGRADVFVTYRSNALRACLDYPSLRLLDLPETWSPEARYGLCLLESAPAGGQAFVELLLGAPGQAALRAEGFEPA